MSGKYVDKTTNIKLTDLEELIYQIIEDKTVSNTLTKALSKIIKKKFKEKEINELISIATDFLEISDKIALEKALILLEIVLILAINNTYYDLGHKILSLTKEAREKLQKIEEQLLKEENPSN